MKISKKLHSNLFLIGFGGFCFFAGIISPLMMYYNLDDQTAESIHTFLISPVIHNLTPSHIMIIIFSGLIFFTFFVKPEKSYSQTF